MLAHDRPRTSIGVEDIKRAAAEAAFGRPLITNVLRGLVVETIVAAALSPDWRLCSEDYAGWDLERGDGKLLEVKQSAARQSWTVDGGKPSRSSFDIRPRAGRWDGALWLPQAAPRRWADTYVFAHHDVFSEAADHRDPWQWSFYVVPTAALPAQDQIALVKVQKLAKPCSFAELHATLSAVLHEECQVKTG